MLKIRFVAVRSRLLSVILAGLALGFPFSYAQAECAVTVARIVPLTGPLLDYGRETPWVDKNKVDPINADGGLQMVGGKCKIVYRIYDSKSTLAGSAEAATKAILQDHADVLMAQGTPDTTNAPSDICERYHVPCIMSDTPVEAWLYGPDGKPKAYKATFEFFFTVADLIKNHVGMIKSLPGGFNGHIGYLYPSDPDGTVFAKLFSPAFVQQGWTATDPGRFQEGLPDFSAIINQFKRNHVEVVTGVLAPADMQNYLQQAAQAGYKPKMYIIDKGTGFPEPMKALGKYGQDLLSVNFWSPAFPGKSSYGGYDGQKLATLYESQNPGKQYSPALAYTDAEYDVLFKALSQVGAPSREAIIKALASTSVDTVVGKVSFNTEHYSVQPLGGAQWRYDETTKRWVKDNVYSAVFPDVKETAKMRLYQQ
ncbi:ABC transporter substrate-binding protein [Paraburkholderia sp. JHI869]|uniref:ABC transporter substrate-binding protein n=1 Tax=Paraburkholderia sp. JHI869 TaxID=3112959 RepID=UPI0031800C92